MGHYFPAALYTQKLQLFDKNKRKIIFKIPPGTCKHKKSQKYSPELYGLTVLLPVLLPILPLTALLNLVRVAGILFVNQRRIGYLKPFDQQT